MDQQKPEKPRKKLDRGELVSIAFQLGFIIALPVVIFGLGGKWLDARAGNSFPMFTLIGIFAAIAFTSIWMYRKFKGYFNDLKENSGGNQKRKDDES